MRRARELECDKCHKQIGWEIRSGYQEHTSNIRDFYCDECIGLVESEE